MQRDKRVQPFSAQTLATSMAMAIVAFTVIDLSTVALVLRRRQVMPVCGYILLAAVLLALAGWLCKRGLWFAARRVVDGSRAQVAIAWTGLGVVAVVLSARFAAIVTAGRGISASPWRLPVYAAVIVAITAGVWLITRQLAKAPGASPRHRMVTALGCFMVGGLALAITTFHSTTYLRIHVGFLLIASTVLQIGVDLSIGATGRSVTPSRQQSIVRVTALGALIGAAYVGTLLGAGNRSSVGLILFSQTTIAQKLTPLLFWLSPLRSASQAFDAPQLLAGTRLDRFNAPIVTPIARGKYAGYNVVWISSDAFRADYLGKATNGVSLTPHLDRLVASSSLFTEAIADFSHTSRSLVSILSGRWDVGLRGKKTGTVANEEELDRNRLPRLLRHAGYYSVANMMGGRWGESFFTARSFPDFDRHVQSGTTCQDQVAEFERHIADFAQRGKVFHWMHFFDTHRALSHRDRRGKSDDGAEENYLASVRMVDGCVGQVITLLEQQGLWDRTLLAFFADHGEALGEHGRIQRHSTCYAHDIRIPLVIRVPGSVQPQRHVRRVQLSDLLPTFANLVGANTDGEVIAGDDFSGLFAASTADDVKGMAFSRGNPGQYPCGSVLSESWHLIYTDSGKFYELYDVARDPAETNNLIASEEKVVKELQPLLDAYFATAAAQNRAAADTEDN